MAINYNLEKVHALSDNDHEFVVQIATLFITEIPSDLFELEKAIELKDYKTAYGFAHKIKPTYDLLGMTVAFEEILIVEEWTRKEGKRKEIKETFKSIALKTEKAIKEITKNYNL
jgi:hypothetical protein